MKKKIFDFTDDKEKKYQVLKLTSLLEKKGLKTPFHIIKIYTHVKWRFYQTTNFNNIPNPNQIKKDSMDLEYNQNTIEKSLKLKVQEVQIRYQTERIHSFLQNDNYQQSRLLVFTKMARINSAKRDTLKKKIQVQKDVYERVYEFGLLIAFFGFVLSTYLVITQQI